MKVIDKSDKVKKEESSSSTYLIEHFDDLWILSKYLSSGDIIYSKTQRKVAMGGDKKKQVVKIMYVELEIKKVDLTSHNLHISGIIKNENEFVAVGSHHSLNFEIGESIEFEIFSVKSKYIQNMFTTHLNSLKHKFIIIMCDVDRLVVSKCSKFSLDLLYEGDRLAPKKYFSTVKQESTIYVMMNVLQDLHLNDYELFIFAGPGLYKKQLKEKFDKQFNSKITHQIDIVDAENSSLQTVLQIISDRNILSDFSQVEVNSKVENFLKLLELNPQKTAYGKEKVEEKVLEGACEYVILSTQFFDELHNEDSDLVLQIENVGSKLYLIDSNSKLGKIVEGLGGIISVLRY